MVRIAWRTAFAVAALFASGAHAASVSLYDDSLGNLPNDQGELFFFGAGGFQTAVPSGVAFDSTLGDSNAGQIGYPNHIPFISPLPSIDLDRTGGITLDFELQIDFEAHANTHRAGFSVTVVTNDMMNAIEIAFWDDTIWAQNSVFNHAEEASYDTTAAMTNYSLQILGSGYSLFAGGSEILSGALRDYSGFGAFPNVYAVDNFLFFGDNTTSARAQVTLGDISLTTSMVPLPPSIGLMLAACVGLVLKGRRSRIK